MLIIAGHLDVDPADRDGYVAQCVEVVRLAQAAPGYLDFSITSDTVDPGRVRVYERWTDVETLLAFRGSGPDAGTTARVLDADVRRYVISDVQDA
jgi:quinol monooxygenase YgiN